MPTFNEKIYKGSILRLIPDIDPDDLKFLCNKSASIYQKINDPCIDNYRISRLDSDNKPNNKYTKSRDNGCCGSCDVKVKNPITNNKFIIGFNFGH